MELSPEILQGIEERAKNLMPPSQMAAQLDLNEDGLKLAIQRHNSEARKAFMRGLSATADTIRKNNIELAMTGSPDHISKCLSAMRDMMNDLSE